MIHKHENPDSFKAGLYALAVHVGLLLAMLVSFNWKAAHPVLNVTEVELWDKLPAQKSIETPKPEPKPEPVIKEGPKPEPKPEPVIKEEPKPEPKPEDPKVDIELEKKKKEEIIKKEKEQTEKLEQDKKLKALQAETREDELKEKQALKEKKAAEKAQKDALKKLQEEALSEEKGNDDKAANAANASLIGEYKAKIQAKIRGNVNKTLCGDGNPELRFEIGLLPTGELTGTPKITKSSGNSACDEAVERAIIASEPLPLPSDPALFSQFRNLNLKFRPND
jgi:colicin import membrane protein